MADLGAMVVTGLGDYIIHLVFYILKFISSFLFFRSWQNGFTILQFTTLHHKSVVSMVLNHRAPHTYQAIILIK